MEFTTDISIAKIVVKDDGPMELSSGVPFNLELLDYLAARRGTRIGAKFTDVQGELGLQADLEDLRLHEGSVYELPESLEFLNQYNELQEHFKNVGGISLREYQGYPYIVIEGGIEAAVIIDFPALVSWIKENKVELLNNMASIQDTAVETGELPLDERTGEPEPEKE